MFTKICLLIAALVGAAAVPAGAQQGQGGKPAPDFADLQYGPSKADVLDFWKAKSEAPAPLVIFIHGGGFSGGDKAQVSPILLSLCLQSGISVASVNYRLSGEAPFPAQFDDSVRAVQFLRSKAKEWNLDPKRFAATGGSAGAGISLWIGFHDDLADPKSDDPVARESTRLTCMAVTQAQSSYDPRVIKEWLGGQAYLHPALQQLFRVTPEEFDTPRADAQFKAASPINFLTADDPPVFMFYTDPKGPAPANGAAGAGIHSPVFGDKLKEAMAKLNLECTVHHVTDYTGGQQPVQQMHRDMLAFFKKHFGMG